MKITHRYNSNERTHFLMNKRETFKIKPDLLYAGTLRRSAGWKDESHMHDFAELVFVADGKGEVIVDGVSHAICKGDLIIYNEHVEHQEKSSQKEPLLVYFVAYTKIKYGDLHENALIADDAPIVYPVGDMFDVFLNYFQLIVNEAEAKRPFFVEIAQNSSRTLLMYLFRLLSKTENTDEAIGHNAVFNDAKNYIDNYYLKDISLDEIANECFTNKYYLSHVFSEKQGTSVKQYILDKRLDDAKFLLCSTDFSIAQISTLCGFDDCNYFCRIFKKSTTQTPKQYRNVYGDR